MASPHIVNMKTSTTKSSDFDHQVLRLRPPSPEHDAQMQGEPASPTPSLADFLSRRARGASSSASSAGADSAKRRAERSGGSSPKRGPFVHSPSISLGDMLRRKAAARAAQPPDPSREVVEDVVEEEPEGEPEDCLPGVGEEEASEEECRACEDSDDDEEAEEEGPEEGREEAAGTRRGNRWWDAGVVHPNGVKNWKDLPNLVAAVSYDCRCGKKCLSRVGGEMQLYEFRRELRAKAQAVGQGGLRDTARDTFEPHYDRTQGAFRETFRVGDCDRVCVMACAVAMGISECTFSNARRDVTAERGRHAGRSKVRQERRSVEEESLDAWIRLQREGMEGDKSTGTRWYYGKLTEKELWRRYAADRDCAQQPLAGSYQQLWKLWKSHREILERPPCGQDACNFCATNLSNRDKLNGLNEPELVAELDAEKAAHKKFNKVERENYTDAVSLAEHRPHEMTCLTIDAPTRHQFDLPSQARSQRDKAKKLDPQNRWQSKVEGVLDAGVGMMTYIARACIGGGANLVCTVMMLALFCHHKLGRALGHVFHLQLDNTTSENKCLCVIGCVSLMVHRGYFLQGRIFFLHVGHTYNDLDQTFSPLITAMLAKVMPTISSLVTYLLTKLAVQRIREVIDLPHLWDFDAMLLKHMNLRGGFANTQQSCGMHEMVIFLDAAGVTRIKMRQSSQSSTWLPEGEGDRVFLEDSPPPSGPPPVLAISADDVWHRTEVQSNVRRWLPYLGLMPTALAAAEAEWEAVFSSVPAGGGIPPAASQLQWMELPQAAIRRAAQQQTVAAAADMVENPTVNPIHTRTGRTYNVARAELRQHHQQQREEATAANSTLPIFLSEYVFFRPKGADGAIALGIVTKAPPGGALAEDDVFDVTEYTHTPLDGHTGFFGTFSAKENPTWNKNTTGSLKYMKHRDILRSQLRVCNVQVWKDGDGSLRAHIKSLRALAVADASCALANIPNSYLHAAEHHHDEGGARGGKAPAAGARGATAGGATTSGETRACRARGDPQAPVVARTRISIYWTEEPAGWFNGIVTSSRRSTDERWETRVQYDDKHVTWHFLDGGADSVKWRVCDSSDEEDG